MSERTEIERLKDLRTYLRRERDAWTKERRESKRFGAQWHYSRGAIFALEDALGHVADLLREAQQ